MKKLALFAVAVATLTFTACNKDDSLSEEDSTTLTAEDAAVMEDIVAEVEEQIDYQVEFRSGEDEDCPAIAVTPEDGSFPKTITIDFGDSCVGPNDKVYTGQIIVEQSAPMHEVGATRAVTFQNFSIDGVQVEGSKTLTNDGPNDVGQPTFTREVSGLVLTFPDGTSSSFDATWTRTWIEGYDTDLWLDDVFAITGSSSGVNRAGVAFSSEILEPLIKKRICPWIVAGVKQVTKGDETFTIDYGDGACNRWATLTLPNGETKEIKLPWWHD